MRSIHVNQRRAGNVLLFTLFMMIGMLGIIALSVDLGYLKMVGTELQRSADSAAIAAAAKLIEEQALPGQTSASFTESRSTAEQFAGLNRVATEAPNLATEDVAIGQLSYPFGTAGELNLATPRAYNAVRVRIRRVNAQNGEVNLFFARALGIYSQPLEGEATAAFISSFRGFRPTSENNNINILPFALDKTTWDDLIAGGGCDNWKFDSTTGRVTVGADKVREVNLYPQGTGSPGNRGTVDFGSANNSTADIRRQIASGVSAADLAAFGGKIELDASGQLSVNGDTGISAGVKDALAAIVGQTRIIPIFSAVSGPGNNAQYTIVAFAGIRVMQVDLTGKPSQKCLIVQPARVIARGGIPATDGNGSTFAYSPVVLVK
jgi:Flp pilus assembly protein TadG